MAVCPDVGKQGARERGQDDSRVQTFPDEDGCVLALMCTFLSVSDGQPWQITITDTPYCKAVPRLQVPVPTLSKCVCGPANKVDTTTKLTFTSPCSSPIPHPPQLQEGCFICDCTGQSRPRRHRGLKASERLGCHASHILSEIQGRSYGIGHDHQSQI